MPLSNEIKILKQLIEKESKSIKETLPGMILLKPKDVRQISSMIDRILGNTASMISFNNDIKTVRLLRDGILTITNNIEVILDELPENSKNRKRVMKSILNIRKEVKKIAVDIIYIEEHTAA